ISNTRELEDLKIQAGGQGSPWGTGGMMTKISAARIAMVGGVRTVITQGRFPHDIEKIIAGEKIGTHFAPQPEPTSARKRWIAYGLVPVGKLYLDEGAVIAISRSGKSLLPAGIKMVEGEFDSQDAVQLCDLQGNEIARGLVNYNSQELEKIRGCHSRDIEDILGYGGIETVVHRDNLVLI
ncbi:glutamate 5-kinase, partial [Cylindrospermopsis raciborskii]